MFCRLSQEFESSLGFASPQGGLFEKDTRGLGKRPSLVFCDGLQGQIRLEGKADIDGFSFAREFGASTFLGLVRGGLHEGSFCLA